MRLWIRTGLWIYPRPLVFPFPHTVDTHMDVFEKAIQNFQSYNLELDGTCSMYKKRYKTVVVAQVCQELPGSIIRKATMRCKIDIKNKTLDVLFICAECGVTPLKTSIKRRKYKTHTEAPYTIPKMCKSCWKRETPQ